MRALRPVLILGATAALLAGALTTPATATIIERGKYSGTDDWVDTECGYPVDVHAEFSGMFSTRVGNKTDSTAFFGADNYTWTETHTDPATGEWYTISANGMWREIKATRLYDNVFAFDQVEAGQPFVITSSAGKVVLRDRGSLIWHYAIDTLGDDTRAESSSTSSASTCTPRTRASTSSCATSREAHDRERDPRRTPTPGPSAPPPRTAATTSTCRRATPPAVPRARSSCSCTGRARTATARPRV